MIQRLYALSLLLILHTNILLAALPTTSLKIGGHKFDVEIATNAEDLRNGLMNRHHLAPHKGMIFSYSKPTMITVWMKNTFIPLDIIFLDINKKIIHIHHSATPKSLEKISSKHKSKYFIEIKGGTCKKLGIKVSQYAEF